MHTHNCSHGKAWPVLQQAVLLASNPVLKQTDYPHQCSARKHVLASRQCRYYQLLTRVWVLHTSKVCRAAQAGLRGGVHPQNGHLRASLLLCFTVRLSAGAQAFRQAATIHCPCRVSWPGMLWLTWCGQHRRENTLAHWASAALCRVGAAEVVGASPQSHVKHVMVASKVKDQGLWNARSNKRIQDTAVGLHAATQPWHSQGRGWLIRVVIGCSRQRDTREAGQAAEE